MDRSRRNHLSPYDGTGSGRSRSSSPARSIVESATTSLTSIFTRSPSRSRNRDTDQAGTSTESFNSELSGDPSLTPFHHRSTEGSWADPFSSEPPSEKPPPAYSDNPNAGHSWPWTVITAPESNDHVTMSDSGKRTRESEDRDSDGLTARDRNLLREFDTVLLIDDSSSMDYPVSEGAQMKRWAALSQVLEYITPIVTKHDSDGISVYFLNSWNTGGLEIGRLGEGPAGTLKKIFAGADGNDAFPERGFQGIKDSGDVREIFESVKPDGGTPMGVRLAKILKKYMQYYEPRQRLEEYVKPLLLIIFTDGEPDVQKAVEEAIERTIERLDEHGAERHQIGIQFFQVGDGGEATRFLNHLDREFHEEMGSRRNMVDTATYVKIEEGEVVMSPERILKTILGGINALYDGDL